MSMALKLEIMLEWELMSIHAETVSTVVLTWMCTAPRDMSTPLTLLMRMVQSQRVDILVSLLFIKGKTWLSSVLHQNFLFVSIFFLQSNKQIQALFCLDDD